ncbi:MAG: hypothetical protein V2A76_02445 [Planctomycetota bacterium]
MVFGRLRRRSAGGVMDGASQSDDPRAAAVLEAVAACLDHQRPRWRLKVDRLSEDGLPRDDREALAALSGALLSNSPIAAEMFGFHPELLATASMPEIRETARRLTRRRRSQPGLVDRLIRLRDHARRILSYKRAVGLPFASALRAAHEAGKLEAFFSRLPQDAPPFLEAGALGEFRRAFRPRGFVARGEVVRFLGRVGCPEDSATGRELLHARVGVAEFIAGSKPICGARPACGCCELLARMLCPGTGRKAAAAKTPEAEEARAVLRPPPLAATPGAACRPGRLRGENLVRRGGLRLATLDARWLALKRRSPPSSARARARWIREEIIPASERLQQALRSQLTRLERGLACIEEELIPDGADEREQIWEQAWKLVSRLRAIEKEREQHVRRLFRQGVDLPNQA